MLRHVNLYLVCALSIISLMPLTAQKISKQNPVRLLALGDSYTIGESVAEDQRWPMQLRTALQKAGFSCHEPDIVATTGWRTDDLKRGLLASSHTRNYDLVSLLIGVNNQYQGKSLTEYKEEFDDLLDIAIQYAAGDKSRVFVLSIPDYGYTPFGKERQAEISEQIDLFNAVNRTLTESKGIEYIDITDISRRGLNEPALVAQDGLHPSGKMYARWVKRILKIL